jgi:hypothetical protein
MALSLFGLAGSVKGVDEMAFERVVLANCWLDGS